jgi:RNA polymerase sigma-70 factor, ECF subfamily
MNEYRTAVFQTDTIPPPMSRDGQTDTDEVLCALIGTERGEDAFRELYERYSTGIYAYCARILGNRDAAKDVFQETFIRFYRKSLLSDCELHVAPYLYAIAHNLCISAIRARKRTVAIEEHTLHDEDRTLERAERGELVRLALQLLPIEYREPVVLHEYNGVSYADIADVLSIPVSTVKIRIYRAKEKMRAILAPYFKED